MKAVASCTFVSFAECRPATEKYNVPDSNTLYSGFKPIVILVSNCVMTSFEKSVIAPF